MKKKVLEIIKSNLNDRIKIAFDAMQAAQASANEEGKSSAGDKYETGRAMAQIERDKYAQQHRLALQDKGILDKINENFQPTQVGLGTLVNTSMGWIFVVISIGIIKIENKQVMVVSPQSPIGMAIFGKKTGEKFDFRGKMVKILEIL